MKTTKNINSNHDAGNMVTQKTNEDFNKEQPSPKNFKKKGKSSSAEITGLGNTREDFIKTEIVDEVNGKLNYYINNERQNEGEIDYTDAK